MKNIYHLSFFAILLLTLACKKEDRVCVKSDFIGEFVGTTVCKSELGATGAPVATIIRVANGPTENELTVTIDNFTVQVNIDGCNILGTDQNADVDVTFSGSLNGDKLKVKLEGTAFNTVLDCESEGEKS